MRQINLTKGNDVFSDYQPRNAITLKIITIYYEKLNSEEIIIII